MVNIMWRIGRSRLVDAISTAQVVNGKLAFGDHFKDALLADVAYRKNIYRDKISAERVKDSLFRLSENLQLRDGDSRTIGEHLESELVVRHSGTQSLLYVFKLPNVQKWYFSLPKKEGNTAASVLYHHLQEQRIKFEIMKKLIYYTLESQVKELRLDKAIVGRSSSFDDCVTDAASLKANVATSVLPHCKRFFERDDSSSLCCC
ncbi:hypothetical protein Plhal304r1_c039g0116971 [Plasmopara halstedii]